MSSHYITGQLSDKVLDELKEVTGITLPGKPNGTIPLLPEDITDLCDEDLMVIFTDFTAWADYAAAQSAVSAVEEREHQRLLDLKRAKDISKGTSKSVSEAKAQAELEAEDQTADYVVKYAYRRILGSVVENMERDAALVSRELSRRLGDKQGGMRMRKDRMTP